MVLLFWKQISSQGPGLGGDRSKKASPETVKVQSAVRAAQLQCGYPVLRLEAKEKIQPQAPKTAPSSNGSRVSRNILTAHLTHSGLLYAGLCWYSMVVLQMYPLHLYV